MLLSLQHLTVLIAIVSLAISIPTDGPLYRDNYDAPVVDFSLHSSTRIGLFKSFRNYIIEKIWTVPSKTRSRGKGQSTRGQIPQKFQTRYGQDVVLRFSYSSPENARAILSASEVLYLDVWEVTEEWIDIRIAKDIVPSFLGLLPPQIDFSYQPLMRDLAQAVYETYPGLPAEDLRSTWQNHITGHHPKSAPQAPQDVFFQEYQPLSVIYPWLQLMASMFPSHVTLTSIGKSAEGRDIPAIRIGAQDKQSPDPGHEHDKRITVLITAGGHAREWISISTAAYLAYNFATGYGTKHNAAVTKFLDHFDIVFIPVMNPDGYEYTWSTDRLWRKNRQHTSVPFCPGIDVDRAFQFQWDGNSTADNPCSEGYAGTKPLEAVEAAALTEWARNQTEHNNVQFTAYLDLHSYAQEILYPYSYSCDEEPPNLETLEEVALGLSKSLRLTHNHYYSINSACEGSVTLTDTDKRARVQLKAEGGSALDYFYHDLGVKYAYQVKLRDTGTYGFLLPKSNIVPTGSEAYAAVLGLGKWLLGNHGIESYPDPASIWEVDESLRTPVSKSGTTRESVEKTTAPVDGHGAIPEDDDNEHEFQMDLRRRRRRR